MPPARERWPFRVLQVEGDTAPLMRSRQSARLVERAGPNEADTCIPIIASVDMRRCRNRDRVSQPDGPTSWR